jgi:hypothetical protein
MTNSQARVLSRFGCAVICITLAVWIRLLLNPVLGIQFPFATLFLAILITAWYGGFRPALLAVILGVLAAHFLLPPYGARLNGFDQRAAGLVLYVCTGLGIAFLAGAMHRAREQAEATAESLRRQATLIDQTYDAVLTWDWDGQIRFWNRGAERLYGFQAAEAIGKSSHELLTAGADGGQDAYLHELQRAGSWEGELQHVTRHGTPLMVESRMVLLGHADGQYVLETNRDISARKMAETALRAANELLETRVQQRTAELAWINESLQASEERLRSYMENAPVTIIVADADDRIIECNSAACSMLGQSRSTIIGTSISDLPPDEQRDIARRDLQALRREGAIQREFRLQRRDGQSVWVSLRAVLLQDGGSLCYMADINASKQFEAALVAERDRVARIVATVPVIICSFCRRPDGSAYFPFAAERITEIYGLSPQELAIDASLIYSRIHPDDTALVQSSIEQSARQMSVWSLDFRVHHPQRGELWVEGQSVPSLESNGDILWQGYVADITQRKLTEQALRASETRLRLLIEGVSGHAIFMLDAKGTVVTWNQGAEDIDGYSAAEIIGRNYAVLFTPEAIAAGKPEEELRLAAAEGRIDVEGWRVRKNGSRFWVNGTVAALYGADRQVSGFAKVTRDSTAKRRNDELLRSVLDSTPDGIVTVDEQGLISMINSAGETLFGYSAAELIGRSVRVLIPAPQQQEYDTLVADYACDDTARLVRLDQEFLAQRKDGTSFPINLAVTEFRLEDRRFFVGIVRDISRQRELQAQLQQSQKMEAFGQLAGGIAHDFNNLLSIIGGYSYVLSNTLSLDDQNRHMLGEIRRAGERAAALTRQLLAFTRQQVLEPKVVDLNAIVTDVESLLRPLIGEDIEFVSVLRQGIPCVKVDPGQVEQVLMNLAVNARDAMSRGGKLTVETSEIERNGGQFVVLSVSDTGIGMSPQVRARIFEPFFTTKGGKGTGLGLSVAQGIVKQSGGSIDVYSEVGIGTTFKILLPAVADGREALPQPDVERSLRGNETILLVEDDASVRELALVALRGYGYNVLAAADGRAALALMQDTSATVQLLVTDVVMPGMSGRYLAEKMQRANPELKVLFMSGYTDDAVVRHGVLQAQVAFLQKPFTPYTLAEKVREVLDPA